MSDIPQLLAAIDRRLADLAAEIIVLEAAKAALDGPSADGRSPAGATGNTTTGSRPRPTRRRRKPPPAATAPATSTAVVATRDDTSTRTAQRHAEAGGEGDADAEAASRRGGSAETLEQLSPTLAGLSATAIAEQAGAG